MIGLKINAKKTKFLSYSWFYKETRVSFRVDGTWEICIELLDELHYLTWYSIVSEHFP
jgi:hypothetical protein